MERLLAAVAALALALAFPLALAAALTLAATLAFALTLAAALAAAGADLVLRDEAVAVLVDLAEPALEAGALGFGFRDLAVVVLVELGEDAGATATAAALLVLAAVTLSYHGLSSYSMLENVQPEQCVARALREVCFFSTFWYLVCEP